MAVPAGGQSKYGGAVCCCWPRLRRCCLLLVKVAAAIAIGQDSNGAILFLARAATMAPTAGQGGAR